jgi:hypothetical protein
MTFTSMPLPSGRLSSGRNRVAASWPQIGRPPKPRRLR